MTEPRPRPEPDELPEAEADERFRRGIETALATPPKHHKDEPKKREKRSRPG